MEAWTVIRRLDRVLASGHGLNAGASRQSCKQAELVVEPGKSLPSEQKRQDEDATTHTPQLILELVQELGINIAESCTAMATLRPSNWA